MIGSFSRLIQAFVLLWAWQLPRSQRVTWSQLIHPAQQWQSERRERRQRKRKRRERLRPPPRRLPLKGGYAGTKSKDRRHTNHQLLRRMYRKY